MTFCCGISCVQIDPKPATSRTSSSNYTGRVRKIFIGGVTQNTTEDDIKNYFAQFGNVSGVMLHDYPPQYYHGNR